MFFNKYKKNLKRHLFRIGGSTIYRFSKLFVLTCTISGKIYRLSFFNLVSTNMYKRFEKKNEKIHGNIQRRYIEDIFKLKKFKKIINMVLLMHIQIIYIYIHKWHTSKHLECIECNMHVTVLMSRITSKIYSLLIFKTIEY